MLRRGLILLVLAAAAEPAAVSARTLLHPRVSVSRDPVAVSGTGFHPRERVYVKLFVAKSYSRRVTATARGRFSATFAGAKLGRCDSFAVSAVGNRGSKAALKLAPMCAPLDGDMPKDPIPKPR